MLFELKYLGCLNLPYDGSFPLPILIAEFLIPVDTLFPNLRVAANGDATAPRRPAPNPFTNPFAPSSLAF